MKSIISIIKELAIVHPALMAIGIGLKVTLAIEMAVGLVDYQQAFANGAVIRDER